MILFNPALEVRHILPPRGGRFSRTKQAGRRRSLDTNRRRPAELFRLFLQQLFDSLGRAAEHGARPALDDGALDEVGVLDHQADDFVVGEFALAEFQLLVAGLARAQKLARLGAHLGDQLAQLRLAYRVEVVVDPLVVVTALTEQPVGLAALRSGRLLVDGNPVVHKPPVVSSQ